ncbi:MAG: geranylgeranylglyceryl/heptaprenylglyceryl phosphate synthase, partial [Alphaproteobacteria bacterium]
VAGITGTKTPTIESIEAATARVRRHTDLPLAVGFGIRTAELAGAVSRVADAAVVGTAVVERVAANLDGEGRAKPGLVDDVLGLVRELAAGVRESA